MLVFTRRRGDSFIIKVGDDTITVMVLGVEDNRARLGIQAPKHIPVHRTEIQQRIDNGVPFQKAVAHG